jgi:hypothetical protein
VNCEYEVAGKIAESVGAKLATQFDGIPALRKSLFAERTIDTSWIPRNG